MERVLAWAWGIEGGDRISGKGSENVGIDLLEDAADEF